MNFREMHFRKNGTTTSVRFQPRTSVVRLWGINHWGRVISPLVKALERTEWDITCQISSYWLVANIEQIPCSPEKNSVVGIGRISVWAHFLIQEDVTGRPNRNKWGILWRLTCQYMEVDTFCAQDAVAVLWHAQKVIVRSDLAVEAQDYGWTETRIFT